MKLKIILALLALCSPALAQKGASANDTARFLAGLPVSGALAPLAKSGAWESHTPRDLSRTIYGHNPFIEAVEIGKYIRDRTDKNDRIAVLGSEPEIYFYAGRKSATGYIYTYALMEPQPFAAKMQAEMIREIESVHPRYLVFSWVDYSWMAQPESDQGIVSWGNAYVRNCYDPVGVADIYSKDKSNVVCDDDVLEYEAVTDDLVYTFRRKSDSPCTASK